MYTLWTCNLSIQITRSLKYTEQWHLSISTCLVFVSDVPSKNMIRLTSHSQHSIHGLSTYLKLHVFWIIIWITHVTVSMLKCHDVIDVTSFLWTSSQFFFQYRRSMNIVALSHHNYAGAGRCRMPPFGRA